MQRKWTIIIALLCLCLFFLLSESKSIQTVKYFPIHPDETFQMAETSLSNLKDQDSIQWTTVSESETSMYLRQDVALLFANGRLMAIQNRWKQQVEKIEQTQNLSLKQPAYLQAIAFHHGEIHQEDDDISSIQHLSLTEQFLIPEGNKLILTSDSDDTTERLRKETRGKLQQKWQTWLQTHELTQGDYHLIPLTALAQYETENLPGRNREQTNQIIGQLWEGLYANYILPLLDNKEETPTADMMPLLLISKDNSFLYVLYESDRKAEVLKQQLPPIR